MDKVATIDRNNNSMNRLHRFIVQNHGATHLKNATRVAQK